MAKTKKQKAAGRTKSKAIRERAKNLVASTILTADKLLVRTVAAPPINTRAPFFAANLKKVCRSSMKGSACYRKTANGKKGARLKAKDFGIDRIDAETLENDCADAGGLFVPGKRKPIRPGKLEIDFLSPAQAKQLNTLEGPNLRLCKRDDERGYLVPVTTPEAAAAIAKDFNDCVKNSKKNMPACAAKFAKQEWKKHGRDAAPLGSLTSRRAFAGLLGW